jgi:hypothetical protein
MRDCAQSRAQNQELFFGGVSYNSRTKRRAKGPLPLVGESKLSALDKSLNNYTFNLPNNK